MSKRFYLDGKWKLKIGDKFSPSTPKEIIKKKWIHAEVPGTIHTDLLRNKLIEEPFYSNNEIKLSWIAESDWSYKTVFDLPFTKDDTAVKLNFEGLDTIAKIYLNGNHVGNSKNMFLKYGYDVAQYLKQKKNELEIFFESPINYSLREEIEHGKLQAALNSSRVYIRKAQYSFGWDWGPQLPPIGIWKDIRLEGYTAARLDQVHLRQRHEDGKVTVEARVAVQRWSESPLGAEVRISAPSGAVLEGSSVVAASGDTSVNVPIPHPQLWWPNG